MVHLPLITYLKPYYTKNSGFRLSLSRSKFMWMAQFLQKNDLVLSQNFPTAPWLVVLASKAPEIIRQFPSLVDHFQTNINGLFGTFWYFCKNKN